MHSSTGLISIRQRSRVRDRSRFDRAARRTLGFTLLEVLLVVALIGLLASVLVGGAASLLNTQPTSPDEIFWTAVQDARQTALRSESDVVLKYVDDKDQGKTFIVGGGAGGKSFPIPKAGDLDVSFLSAQKGGTVAVIAGTVVETQKLPFVTFYADGTCSPFRVQFYRPGGTHITAVDPWTCAPVLTAADANGQSPRS